MESGTALRRHRTSGLASVGWIAADRAARNDAAPANAALILDRVGSAPDRGANCNRGTSPLLARARQPVVRTHSVDRCSDILGTSGARGWPRAAAGHRIPPGCAGRRVAEAAP